MYCYHRVGRVLSVSPVVGIGTPPPLQQQASVPLHPLVRGGGHTRLRLKGWGSPNSNEGTYTVVLYIYKYFVIVTKSKPSILQCVTNSSHVYKISNKLKGTACTTKLLETVKESQISILSAYCPFNYRLHTSVLNFKRKWHEVSSLELSVSVPQGVTLLCWADYIIQTWDICTTLLKGTVSRWTSIITEVACNLRTSAFSVQALLPCEACKFLL